MVKPESLKGTRFKGDTPLRESKYVKTALQILHENSAVRPVSNDTIIDGKKCKTA